MRQISGGHEFRPHGGLLLSRDWRKSMQNSPFLPGLLRAPPRELEPEPVESWRSLSDAYLLYLISRYRGKPREYYDL